MRYKIYIASALLMLGRSGVVAQPADPAAANQALIGAGPRVDVQQSANGTIDVGGAGAINPNLTGGNVRGNLGASVPPTTAAPSPSPGTGLPTYSLQTPNFGPDLRGAAPGRKPTKEELQIAESFVLPRFRAQWNAEASQAAPLQGADAWRYRYFNGRWWYWRPDKTWAYWTGSRWQAQPVRRSE
jgi:hypothetical protein